MYLHPHTRYISLSIQGCFFFKYNTYYRKSFKANYLQNDYNNLKMDDTIKHGSQPPIYGNVFWQLQWPWTIKQPEIIMYGFWSTIKPENTANRWYPLQLENPFIYCFVSE